MGWITETQYHYSPKEIEGIAKNYQNFYVDCDIREIDRKIDFDMAWASLPEGMRKAVGDFIQNYGGELKLYDMDLNRAFRQMSKFLNRGASNV